MASVAWRRLCSGSGSTPSLRPAAVPWKILALFISVNHGGVRLIFSNSTSASALDAGKEGIFAVDWEGCITKDFASRVSTK